MRLIDADKLTRKDGVICVHADGKATWAVPVEVIKNQETMNNEPVAHARWEEDSNRPDSFICSSCRHGLDMYFYESRDFKYCPHCGAKMDLEENE